MAMSARICRNGGMTVKLNQYTRRPSQFMNLCETELTAGVLKKRKVQKHAEGEKERFLIRQN